MKHLILLLLCCCAIINAQYPPQHGYGHRQRPSPHHRVHRIHRIQVSPSNIRIAGGESMQFRATAYDHRNQIVSCRVVWTAQGGSITQSGRFTATGRPGSYIVVARDIQTGVQGFANVTITRSHNHQHNHGHNHGHNYSPYDRVNRITITPSNIRIAGGESVQLNATAYNYRNQIVSCRVVWTAQGGTITRSGRFTATERPGSYTIVARDPQTGIQGFANITITRSHNHHNDWYPQPNPKPYPGPKPYPRPKPYPGPDYTNARIIVKNYDVGGNFFEPKVKAEIQVIGHSAQTIRMYAIQGNGYEEELQAFSCSNNSTVNFRARFSSLLTNYIEFRLYDNRGRMIAVERRQPRS
ncbi:MAG: hypothetical protein KBC30_02930 [Planctomycetes bacterium]|nr:hypothetical protein [Planctomycetota bacterium]HNZ66978.1 hypothetical protein [Planctomycetota bacterium]HPY75478.1 hypothetical protein [Planctomycetota bacterium]HQB01354.1 hypothetical protein [Planctomycetota bacterium]HRU52045.1 hypothetical protein [Planctomycetota bacterium]